MLVFHCAGTTDVFRDMLKRWLTGSRDRPELIFINSAETETGPKIIMQFRPKTKLRPNLSPYFGRNRNRNRKSIRLQNHQNVSLMYIIENA